MDALTLAIISQLLVVKGLPNVQHDFSDPNWYRVYRTLGFGTKTDIELIYSCPMQLFDQVGELRNLVHQLYPSSTTDAESPTSDCLCDDIPEGISPKGD